MPASPDVPSPEALWRRFRGQVHRFLAARLPSEADADDVLQDVFLRLLEGSTALEDVDNVRAWLYRIARHALADFYRTRTRRTTEVVTAPDALPPLPDAPAADNLSPYSGTHDVHEEVLSWLRPMIDELPEHDRLPLLMADVEGRSQREVAEALGLSLSGAKSRVQRARVRLGMLLQRCCALEFGPDGRVAAFHRRAGASAAGCEDGCG